MKSRYLLPVLLFLPFLPLNAQDFSRLDVPFTVDGQMLDLGLAGGLQNGTFSTIDLNEDEYLDLFVFDRAGNKVRTYINCGSEGRICYEYAPSYQSGFPADLRDWALMRDYNDDGVEDIFTGYIGGVRVYRGSRAADGTLSYDLVEWAEDQTGTNILQVPVGNDYNTIFVAQTDNPVIEDLDGDGDLDLLSFSDAGIRVYHYKNYSQELNLTDTLVLRLEDRCWGKFSEGGLSAELFLSPDCVECGEEGQGLGGPNDHLQRTPLHAGSTLGAMDIDGDKDFDLVLGDLTGPNLVFAENGGTAQEACITRVDADFPSYDVPVNIQVFLGVFFLDVNNDGKKDMIATPTVPQQNQNHVWLYLNNGQDGRAQFQLSDRNFLVDEMLHVGFLSGSAFFDYDNDGLHDLILAGSGIKEDTRPNKGVLQLWRNAGTMTEPAYELADADFLNASTIITGRDDLAPALGDLDNDGDQDLFLGSTQGDLYYFENTAGPDAIAQFAAPVHPYPSASEQIFVGQNAKPALYDIDEDGDLDLIIGEGVRNQTPNGVGSINWYENTGTPSAPLFTATARSKDLYGFTSSEPNQNFNYSDPEYIETPDGPLLVVGGNDGTIDVLSDVVGGDLSSHTVVSDLLGNIDVGRRSTISLEDIDNDSYYEMIVGNIAGGFELFNTDLVKGNPVSTTQTLPKNDVILSPVPTSRTLVLSGCEDCQIIGFYDLNGRRRSVQPATKVNVEYLSSGIHLAEVRHSDGTTSIHKVIIVR